MCKPAHRYDRAASAMSAIGLMLIFCGLNFFPRHGDIRGFLAGAGVGLELVAIVRIALTRRST